MYEQTSMISTPQAEAKPAARYYEINEDTARNAHYCVHMSDYQPGSATNGYRAAVDEAAALVEARKAKVSPHYHDKLDALLDRYARRLAQWTNDYNRNQASYPSQFISGAGNYNMKKHEKQMSREGTLWKEYDEIKAILNKIAAVGTGAVDLADPHAREMLTDQLQKLQAQLDRNMATTAAPTRYTINLDGTLEKWYLEHDGGEIIYLRKTPRPKWNCGMKEFPAAEVYETYRAARNAQKGHL